ncbi:hypothetical protein PPERSA_05892 [Pseudocohnilembus persalinus]|uniref:Uncharacterized protein n=1 Tax=Pseudocohnilembus persalinus TaxID=266149 RepID=A0A0V0R433_PSEPJ|nr:hypothetical protein PPERSA_05892 [Pseudocohnilembus persalinus]|eukprot:KRX09223.1 hypothetical protein PPERSA_05892 [Pseudocohnilembus persalinus]
MLHKESVRNLGQSQTISHFHPGTQNYIKYQPQQIQSPNRLPRMDLPLHYQQYNNQDNQFRPSRQEEFDDRMFWREQLNNNYTNQNTNYIDYWKNQLPLLDPKERGQRPRNPLDDINQNEDKYFQNIKDKRGWGVINDYMNAGKLESKINQQKRQAYEDAFNNDDTDQAIKRVQKNKQGSKIDRLFKNMKDNIIDEENIDENDVNENKNNDKQLFPEKVRDTKPVNSSQIHENNSLRNSQRTNFHNQSNSKQTNYNQGQNNYQNQQNQQQQFNGTSDYNYQYTVQQTYFLGDNKSHVSQGHFNDMPKPDNINDIDDLLKKKITLSIREIEYQVKNRAQKQSRSRSRISSTQIQNVETDDKYKLIEKIEKDMQIKEVEIQSQDEKLQNIKNDIQRTLNLHEKKQENAISLLNNDNLQ